MKRRLAALIVAIVAAGAAALVAWWDGYDYGYAECAGDLDK